MADETDEPETGTDEPEIVTVPAQTVTIGPSTGTKTCKFCGRMGNRGYITDDAGEWCSNREQCQKRVDKAQREAMAGCCIDCAADPEIDTSNPKKWRPAEAPGPRCVTHRRAVKKARKIAAHGRRIQGSFGMTREQYTILYAIQGGKCFICQWATGKTKNLAVDHDHALAEEHDHPVDQGCPHCWRALLCGPCNQTIGRLGVEALCRAIVVLGPNPPARGIFVIDNDATMEDR